MDGRAILELTDDGIAIIKLGTNSERRHDFSLERLASLEQIVHVLPSRKPAGIILDLTSSNSGYAVETLAVLKQPELAKKFVSDGFELTRLIEALPCPTVAKIAGRCEGIALELSLACKYRVLADDAVVSFGDLNFGLVPPFGGLGRTGALMGVSGAADVILQRTILRGGEALKARFADAVVPLHGLHDTAMKIVSGHTSHRRTLPLKERLLSGPGRWITKRKLLALRKASSESEQIVIDALLAGQSGGDFPSRVAALLLGSTVQNRLKLELNAQSLRSIGAQGIKKLEHLTAAILGCGSAAQELSALLAVSGAQIVLCHDHAGALTEAEKSIRKIIELNQALSPAQKSYAMNRVELCSTGDSPTISNAGFILDATGDDTAESGKLLNFANQAPQECFIGICTDSIDLSETGKLVGNPERVFGFRTRRGLDTIEISRGRRTSDKALVMACAIAVKINKTPIVTADVPYGLTARILYAGMSETSGCREEKVKRSLLDFGFSEDWICECSREETFSKIKDLEEKYPGHFSSPANQDGDAAERVVLRMINEAYRCLDEGVAGTPGEEAIAQINLASVWGAGFPIRHGGVIEYSQTLGIKTAGEKLEKLSAAKGSQYAPCKALKPRVEKSPAQAQVPAPNN